MTQENVMTMTARIVVMNNPNKRDKWLVSKISLKTRNFALILLCHIQHQPPLTPPYQGGG
jgi:hypothetical protein